MNLKLGWKKGKGISMASIRERNGKFNVIYNYKDDSGKRRQSKKDIKQKQKQISAQEKSNINRKWAHLL